MILALVARNCCLQVLINQEVLERYCCIYCLGIVKIDKTVKTNFKWSLHGSG